MLKSLHYELDTAVLGAYGWHDLMPGPSALRQAQGERSSTRTDISVRGEPVEPRLIEQTLLERLVARILTESPTAQTEAQLAASFAGKGRWKFRLPDILAALEAHGRARRLDEGKWMG